MTEPACRAHLDTGALQEHWDGVSSTLSRLLSVMDSKDEWASDEDPEFLDLLGQLVDCCESPSFARSMQSGANAANLASVFALLCTSRFARVLEMIERQQAGLVSQLILGMSQIGGDVRVWVDLFCERLTVIHRFDLMGQIFSASRAKRIAQDIELISGGGVA